MVTRTGVLTHVPPEGTDASESGACGSVLLRSIAAAHAMLSWSQTDASSASHKECTHVRQSQRAPLPIAFEIFSLTTMHSFRRRAAEPLWTSRCCTTQPKLCLGVHEHMHVSRVKVSDLLCCRLLSPFLHLTTHDAGSTCAVNKPVLQQGRATALVSSKRSSQLPSPRCLCDPDAGREHATRSGQPKTFFLRTKSNSSKKRLATPDYSQEDKTNHWLGEARMSLQTRGDVERGFPRVRSKFYDVPRSSGSRRQQQQPPIVAAPFKPVSGGWRTTQHKVTTCSSLLVWGVTKCAQARVDTHRSNRRSGPSGLRTCPPSLCLSNGSRIC